MPLYDHDYPGEYVLNINIVYKNKKDYLDLLLLADEQEDMIDKYLDRGTLFALYDDDLKSVCVVTYEGDDVYELQNLATYPQFQKKGYGRHLINHACENYKDKGVMIVGTGESLIPFYENSGFELSHCVENYYVDHYKEPIFDEGVQLKDKYYLKRRL